MRGVHCKLGKTCCCGTTVEQVDPQGLKLEPMLPNLGRRLAECSNVQCRGLFVLRVESLGSMPSLSPSHFCLFFELWTRVFLFRQETRAVAVLLLCCCWLRRC